MAREDKTKHTLFLRAGDWSYLEALLKPKGITTSHAVRTIISRYVDNLRSREKTTQPLDLKDMTDE